jgi:ketosteroid isomerase-like protein
MCAETHATAAAGAPDPMDTIVAYFEALTPDSLAGLAFVYTPDATFKDPFHAVQGHSAISRVYTHMFEALEGPHFVVTGRVQQGAQCFLVWDFHFRFKGRRAAGMQTVRGCSHLRLAPCGRIEMHATTGTRPKSSMKRSPAWQC